MCPFLAGCHLVKDLNLQPAMLCCLGLTVGEQPNLLQNC